jgi:hypothetical protein
MITANSRYAQGTLVRAGSTVSVRRIGLPANTGRYKIHHWSVADRLDLLAARYFGDAKQWWRIMDMNPLVQSPTDLRPGMLLKVPDA